MILWTHLKLERVKWLPFTQELKVEAAEKKDSLIDFRALFQGNSSWARIFHSSTTIDETSDDNLNNPAGPPTY